MHKEKTLIKAAINYLRPTQTPKPTRDNPFSQFRTAFAACAPSDGTAA